jgi:ATP-binding cassette subfamily B protein
MIEGAFMKVSLFPFLRPFLRETVAGLFLKLVEAVFELMLPILLAQIIDIGISGRDIPFIYKTGGQMFLLICAGLICAVLCQYCAAVAAQGFGDKLRTALFLHINRLSVSEQRKIGTESLMNRVTADVERLQLAVSMLIRLGSRIPFVVLGGVIASMVVDLPLSMVIIVGSVAFLLVAAMIIVSVFPLYTELQGRLDRIGKTLRESFLGVRVIRVFRRRQYQRERFDVTVDEHEKTAVRAAKISSFMQPSTQLIMNLAICGILWFGAGRVNSGALTTGQIVAMINYILQILVALILIANLTVIYTRAAASRTRVREVMELPVFFEKGEAATVDRISPALDGADFSLEFRNVTLRYPGEHAESESRTALQNISFRVAPGETLAITGTTGSGKSTLVSLMIRLSDPTEGSIRVLEKNTTDIPVDELRRRVSVVHQAPKLFSGTVAENIRWGNENADDDALREALNVAQARDFVDALPEGLSSRVERNGRNFSGGQRQRLAIARALVKQADFLILDDSTSALDYLTESRLYHAIKEANRETGRTLIVISQRIAAIRDADRILVLDEGKRVGFGTHKQLLRDCPEYKEIVDSQLFGKEAT